MASNTKVHPIVEVSQKGTKPEGLSDSMDKRSILAQSSREELGALWKGTQRKGPQRVMALLTYEHKELPMEQYEDTESTFSR